MQHHKWKLENPWRNVHQFSCWEITVVQSTCIDQTFKKEHSYAWSQVILWNAMISACVMDDSATTVANFISDKVYGVEAVFVG